MSSKFCPRLMRVRSEQQRSGEDYIISNFILCTPYQHSGDLMKKNGMGRGCGMYGGQERCIQDFGGES